VIGHVDLRIKPPEPVGIGAAAVYIRVSTAEQAEGHSLGYQLDSCRALAEKLGASSIEVYEDSGFSAKTTNRPAFQRLIGDAEARRFKTIFVYKLDRFARSRLDSLVHKDRLQKAGVKLISVTEPLDDSPSGLIHEGMLELLAEWYSRDLQQKVGRGLRKRAEKGLMNGMVPFGYQQSANPKLDPPTLVPVESAAVRHAYEWYATGAVTYKEIARSFNDEGFRTRHRPSGRDPDGARLWTGDSIRALLQNPLYKGCVTHKGEEMPGLHEAIVEPELWRRTNAVGARLRGRSTTWKPVRFYPLAGILKCAGCGSNLQGNHTNSGNLYRYYRETAARRGVECSQPQIAVRADRIEAEVDHVVSRFQTPHNVRQRVVELMTDGPQVTDVVAEDKRLRERLRRSSRLYADLQISEVEYESERRRIETELAKLNVTEERADEALAQFDVLQVAWARATPEEKRGLGLALFEAIYFDLEVMEIAEVVVQPAFRPWVV